MQHQQVALPLQREAAMKPPTDRASLQLLHGAWRKRTQGACSSLPLALWWRRVLVARTTHLEHLQVASPLQREAAMKPPTDRASLRLLLHGARRRLSQGACVVESACRQDQRTSHTCFPLIEQACGCSMVRGGSTRGARYSDASHAPLKRLRYAALCSPPPPRVSCSLVSRLGFPTVFVVLLPPTPTPPSVPPSPPSTTPPPPPCQRRRQLTVQRPPCSAAAKALHVSHLQMYLFKNTIGNSTVNELTAKKDSIGPKRDFSMAHENRWQ